MLSDQTHTEKELLLQIAAGDELCFSVLFDRYKDKLYTYLSRLTGSVETTEDIIQNVFMKLWSKRQELAAIDVFPAYLFRMARNQLLNGIRKNAREMMLLAELRKELEPGQDAVSEHVDIQELKQKLREAVDRLPAQQKKVFQLSRDQGMKREEIASALQITPSTVNNHLFQALKNIREYLAPYLHSIAAIECFIILLHFSKKG